MKRNIKTFESFNNERNITQILYDSKDSMSPEEYYKLLLDNTFYNVSKGVFTINAGTYDWNWGGLWKRGAVYSNYSKDEMRLEIIYGIHHPDDIHGLNSSENYKILQKMVNEYFNLDIVSVSSSDESSFSN